MDFPLPRLNAARYVSHKAANAYYENSIDFESHGEILQVSPEFMIDRLINNYIANLEGLTTIDCTTSDKKLLNQIKPEFWNYESIEKLSLLRVQLSAIHRKLAVFTCRRPELPLEEQQPVTKTAVHDVFKNLYAYFDADPANKEAAERRQILEYAADILELPALEVSRADNIIERRTAATGTRFFPM